MTRLLVLLALATPLNAALLGQIAVPRGSRTGQITAVQRTQTEINVASAARDLRKHLQNERKQAKTATSPSSTSALAATFAAAAAAADSAAAPFSEDADPSDSTATAAAAVTPTQLVESFVAATERGDAAAALALVTDNFLYKTHSATTESRAAAEKRLHTKCPAPAKVTSAPSPSTHPQAKP